MVVMPNAENYALLSAPGRRPPPPPPLILLLLFARRTVYDFSGSGLNYRIKHVSS